VGVLMDSRKFSWAPIISGASSGHLCDSSAFLCSSKNAFLDTVRSGTSGYYDELPWAWRATLTNRRTKAADSWEAAMCHVGMSREQSSADRYIQLCRGVIAIDTRENRSCWSCERMMQSIEGHIAYQYQCIGLSGYTD